MILFICNKNNSDKIIEYLYKQYSKELKIDKLIEPSTNGNYMIELIKHNNIQINRKKNFLSWLF